MKKLYITVGSILASYFGNSQKNFLLKDEIDNISKYIYDGLLKDKSIELYQDVIFSVDEDSIIRTCLYNNKVFELVGNTIYLIKDTVPQGIRKEYYSPVVDCFVNKFINEKHKTDERTKE